MIEVKPIGLFRMQDDQGIDDKELAVPLTDPGWNTLESLDGVSDQLQKRDRPLLHRLQAAGAQEG
jgi:inorganic pyrophosphatase